MDEVSRRFAISRKELLKDLDDVFQYVGVHPFTPDCLSDVFIDEESDVISVSLGDYFAKPPRLSPAEALSLLTAAKAALRLDYRFSDDDSFYEAQRAEDANDILRTAVNKLELSLTAFEPARWMCGSPNEHRTVRVAPRGRRKSSQVRDQLLQLRAGSPQ